MTEAEITAIEQAFRDYAAAHTGVVAAMNSPSFPEHLIRTEQNASDRLLSLLRRHFPVMVAASRRVTVLDRM